MSPSAPNGQRSADALLTMRFNEKGRLAGGISGSTWDNRSKQHSSTGSLSNHSGGGASLLRLPVHVSEVVCVPSACIGM